MLQQAIDELNHGRHAPAASCCWPEFWLLIALVKGVFLYAQRWILIGISREIEFDLRNDLFRHLERQDSGFYQRYRTGDIMARLTNDLNAVRMLLGPAIMYSANTVMFTVGALFFLLRISPYLTLVALAPAPIASILVQYLGRKIHDRFERIQASFSEISAQAQENYSGARLVRAFAREESQISLFEQLNRQYIRARAAAGSADGHVVADAGIHSRRLDDHHAACGRPPGLCSTASAWAQFVAFNTYMILLIWPIIAVGWVVNIFQRGTASVKRIDELLRAGTGYRRPRSRPSDRPRCCSERRDRISPPELQLRRDAGTARYLAADSGRLKPRHCRADGLRQNHAGEPDLTALRGARGLAADRWQADPRISPGGSAPQHRHGAAGNISLQ